MNGREKNIYMCGLYVKNSGAVNVWSARYYSSTPLEKKDVIFMIVKTSSLRNKSDEETRVSLDHREIVEWCGSRRARFTHHPFIIITCLSCLFRIIKLTYSLFNISHKYCETNRNMWLKFRILNSLTISHYIHMCIHII